MSKLGLYFFHLQEDIVTDQISIKEYVEPFEKQENEKERKIKRVIEPLKW